MVPVVSDERRSKIEDNGRLTVLETPRIPLRLPDLPLSESPWPYNVTSKYRRFEVVLLNQVLVPFGGVCLDVLIIWRTNPGPNCGIPLAATRELDSMQTGSSLRGIIYKNENEVRSELKASCRKIRTAKRRCNAGGEDQRREGE